MSWMTRPARCPRCLHEFMAAFTQGTESIRCPNCGQRSTMAEVLEEDEEGLDQRRPEP